MSRGKHYCKQLVPSRTLSVDQCCILRHSRCLMMVVKLSSELSIKDCVGSRRSHVYLKSWVSVHCLSWAWPCQELKPQTREAIARFSSPIPHHEPSPCSEGSGKIFPSGSCAGVHSGCRKWPSLLSSPECSQSEDWFPTKTDFNWV